MTQSSLRKVRHPFKIERVTVKHYPERAQARHPVQMIQPGSPALPNGTIYVPDQTPYL